MFNRTVTIIGYSCTIILGEKRRYWNRARRRRLNKRRSSEEFCSVILLLLLLVQICVRLIELMRFEIIWMVC
ncbi:hypothetical protein Hanom_Chr04g00364181 [Helianthus anomalus]